MNHLLTAPLLLATLAAAQPPPGTPQVKAAVMTETQLLPLLTGEVLILGSEFPGRLFQKTVLERLKVGTLRVRVLTGKDSLAYFAPVQQAGGVVRAFPGRITGAVAVAGGSLIVARGNGYQVVSGPGVAASVQSQFESAWRFAK
ncbi:hypothetical protein GCM10008959_23270 [Deinococcus seoulensis]|uniref:Uncharacterized protein n=1 Tax=Deinococcus seoulensis TaxID=1837379 RepID=A0ABQ2RUH5_9DEIO|nr:hypothetical protein [Deinococcus seoulensis]GGR60808.1 hypothetical protein GCM10008959_23270 [Deinococcus seoulensis]